MNPGFGRGQLVLNDAQRAERRRYGDLAMDTLRQAARAGYRDAARLRKAPDLFPLRARADFQALLMDLPFLDQPFAGGGPGP